MRINQDIIDEHCSGQNNQFMPHKYRHYILPMFQSTYDVLYKDNTYLDSEKQIKERPLLLKSRIANERVIISSMALDWAEHLEQLANAVIYVTEGINQIALVLKNKDDISSKFAQLGEKAKKRNIPFKVYDCIGIDDIFDNYKAKPHRIFIFSYEWSNEEIRLLWYKVLNSNENVTFYQLIESVENTEKSFLYKCLFSNSILNNQIFLDSLEWIFSNYIEKRWRKSIWTYEYITDLLNSISIDKINFLPSLYEEIKKHYKFESKKTNFQSYDNVFNSSCSCNNVLSSIYHLCKKNNISVIKVKNKEIGVSSIFEEKCFFGNWIMTKLCEAYETKISWQDGIMAICSLLKTEYLKCKIDNEDNRKKFDLVVSFYLNKLEDLLPKNENDFFVINLSNADYGKIIKFLCACFELNFPYNYKEKLELIIRYLAKTQKYNGEWKNLSETAELTLAIISSRKVFEDLDMNETLNSILDSSIRYIENSYSKKKTSWLDDENITAKSLHILYLYDRDFNFFIDDFLEVISNTGKKYVNEVNVANNIKALDYAQGECNILSDLNIKFTSENIELQKELKFTKRIITRYKLIVGTLTAISSLLILFIIWMVGILQSKYTPTLQEIYSENTAVILSTIIGFFATTILTGVFCFVKAKLIKNGSDSEDKKK